MRIRRLPDGAEVPAEAGQSLLDAALSAGLDLSFGCQVARCGVCMVVVSKGSEHGLAPPSRVEAAALAGMHAPLGARLACQARLLGDVEVRPIARSGRPPGPRAEERDGGHS